MNTQCTAKNFRYSVSVLDKLIIRKICKPFSLFTDECGSFKFKRPERLNGIKSTQSRLFSLGAKPLEDHLTSGRILITPSSFNG